MFPWRDALYRSSTAAPVLTTGSGQFSNFVGGTSKKWAWNSAVNRSYFKSLVNQMQSANVTATTHCCREHPTRWCPVGTSVKRQDTCGNYSRCQRGEKFSCAVMLCKCFCMLERNFWKSKWRDPVQRDARAGLTPSEVLIGCDRGFCHSITGCDCTAPALESSFLLTCTTQSSAV